MEPTTQLLKAKLSQKFTYKEMLKISTQLGLVRYPEDLIVRSELKEKFLRVQYDQKLADDVKRIKTECQIVSIFDDLFPQKLREIYRPPLILFGRGDFSLLNQAATGIVGARVPTPYSGHVLNQFIPELVRKKRVIVSGLAKGVDGMSHKITLENHGKTIAVLGNGINQFYPGQNEELQREIFKKGLVISEYLPDTLPSRFRFPARNRIIAGLSDDLIVTEAKLKSGSLITANVALNENRNVYAVPGPIDSKMSEGTNQLIAAGATPLTIETAAEMF